MLQNHRSTARLYQNVSPPSGVLSFRERYREGSQIPFNKYSANPPHLGTPSLQELQNTPGIFLGYNPRFLRSLDTFREMVVNLVQAQFVFEVRYGGIFIDDYQFNTGDFAIIFDVLSGQSLAEYGVVSAAA